MEQTLKYKGYNIEIVADDSAESPRAWDNAGVMCCWHSRYNLGDMEKDGKSYRPISANYSEPIDLLYELANVDREEYQEKQYEEVGEYNDMEYAELYQKIEERGTIIRSLSLYDHSGITIYIGSPRCRWDGSRVGWVYITKDKIEAEGWTPEQAEKYLEGEVQVYDDYLTGNVYGYRITDADGEDKDSCYGYYGSPEESGCIDEAKSTIDWYVKKDQEEYEKLPKKRAAEMYTV